MRNNPHHPHTPPPEWINLLQKGRIQSFQKGDGISRPQMEEDQVFLILEGEARIYLSGDQRELTLGCLSQGGVYVTHTPAWVDALTDTRIQFWPIRELRSLLRSQPELGIAAFREVGRILQEAINLIEDLAFRSVEQRLARYLLLQLSDQGPTADSIIQLTGHTELLASLLGTSRQTLSSLLNRMIKDNIIQRVDRRTLKVLKPEKLKTLSAS